MSAIKVAVIMGSSNDMAVMKRALEVLDEMKVGYETKVLSAHRSPEETARYARSARKKGISVIIAGAGGAAHLAGTIAAHTALPVIGVPIASSPLGGFDSLLSTVQMPPGVPVATVGVGESGATNAAILAAQILALNDPAIKTKIDRHKRNQVKKVMKMSAEIHK